MSDTVELVTNIDYAFKFYVLHDASNFMKVTYNLFSKKYEIVIEDVVALEQATVFSSIDDIRNIRNYILHKNQDFLVTFDSYNVISLNCFINDSKPVTDFITQDTSNDKANVEECVAKE
jgi:hypothetical protein